MNKSKVKVVVNGIIQKIQMIVGICAATFGVLGFLVSIGHIDSMDIFMCMFFIVIGALLIYFSMKRSKLAKTFKIYVQMLSNDKTYSIENLASQLGTSQDVVKENLKLLIYKKFFVNAYIDVEGNCVVFPQTTNIVHTNIQQSTDIEQNTNQATIEYKTATCKNCGGIGKIQKGTVSDCEFCGSKIQ